MFGGNSSVVEVVHVPASNDTHPQAQDQAQALPLSPDFIQFLFSSKPKFDCYFKVGNESQGEPVRIGAVKLMLMAHSEVFRLELEDSELKEKQDVPVKDIHPDTFKGMLKYVYGHDTTTDMCFQEADNLLYVAEKYMIVTLKNKLATRLMKLLNPDNICSLLNNPACYTHLELNSAITKILRYETDKVLDSSQFVLMNADGFLKILEQDGLAVAEIELWRAAIKWAKHRANTEDGQVLRETLSSFTPHLRLCTLTGNEFCTEVANTAILTREEISTVCLSIGNKEAIPNLDSFSNETSSRKALKRKNLDELILGLDSLTSYSSQGYTWDLSTKNKSIELLPLVCRAKDGTGTYRVECSVTLTKAVATPAPAFSFCLPATPTFTPSQPSSAFGQPSSGSGFAEKSASAKKMKCSEIITFVGNVERGFLFEVPLTVDGRNIVLSPNTKYTVKVKLDGDHICQFSNNSGSGSYDNDHLTLRIPSIAGIGYMYEFPCTRLQYRVI